MRSGLSRGNLGPTLRICVPALYSSSMETGAHHGNGPTNQLGTFIVSWYCFNHCFSCKPGPEWPDLEFKSAIS